MNTKLKLNLVQIYNSKESLEKFCSNNLPIKMAYNLVKLRRTIDSEFTAAEEQRNKLIKKYDPTGAKVPEDKIPEFINEFNEFLRTVSIDVEFEKIDIESLQDNITLSADELARLDFLFIGMESPVVKANMSVESNPNEDVIDLTEQD